MTQRRWIRPLAWGLAGATFAAPLQPETAQACGGFFCSQNAPVNQAAERIIFADNEDGTVTAIIQIMYEGPSESFSWLLPITSVPEEGDLGVASDIAFQNLQNATNPQYTLTTRVEGQCKTFGDGTSGFGVNGGVTGGGGFADAGVATGGLNGGGVTVEASGVVGAFEWTVLSFDQSLPDVAEVATVWLEDNGYDVGEGAPGLIRPYLEDGLNLLALRLTKGADTGSIRPLRITYPAEQPMIPIKLTAVAANEDMGVMAWLLSKARAVPQNYLSLELNEARINWFNASASYGDVVNAAADEAGGHGFVTEYADETGNLSQTVWSAGQEQQWQSFRGGRYGSFAEIFEQAFQWYGGSDGFWDAVRRSVTLADGVAFEDFKLCPDCYAAGLQFSPSALIAALEEDVIKPIRDVQDLIDSYDYVTRLYTTLSAAEMTTDPLFTFNPDLDPVSNLHTAERIIECSSEVQEFEAPWRIELPQGSVIRGTADQVGTWPDVTDDQPANLRIKRLSAAGQGATIEDNQEVIDTALSAYNASIPSRAGATGGTAGNTTGSSGTAASSSGAGDDPNGAGGASAEGGGGGCTLVEGTAGAGWTLAAGWILALRNRRRFRCQS